MSVSITNPTATDLPYGFGIHPYCPLPFDPDGDLDQTRVILPASKFWVLEDFLPSREIRAVDNRLDFRAGQAMRGLKLDDVLTGLEFVGERCTCRLVDLARKAEFRLTFDRNFRELVVYTPPPRPGVISLEPYTQTTERRPPAPRRRCRIACARAWRSRDAPSRDGDCGMMGKPSWPRSRGKMNHEAHEAS